MRKPTPTLKTIVLLFILTALPTIEPADTLTIESPLVDNQTLISSGGTFALGFFTPSNSNKRYLGIWYNKITVQTVVWVANRDKPITQTNLTASLAFTSNSTISILANNSTVWSTSSPKSLVSPALQLLENGNLILKESSVTRNDEEDFCWQSFHHPTDTLLPGMKVGVNFVNGMNNTDPSPGDLSLLMDISGVPEMLLASNGTVTWRAGPWNGLYYDMDFTFINNADEVSYAQNPPSSLLTRLVVNNSGVIQQWMWSDDYWHMNWYSPKDQCDIYRVCGRFGVCDPSDSLVCSCLPGFTPRSPANWALRDGTDGCARETDYDCTYGFDGFMTLKQTKLPDTANAMVDMSIGLDECRQRCARKCTCIAYAAADIQGSGSGCIMWTSEDLSDIRVYTSAGQDLYFRLAAADLGSSGSESKKHKIVLIAFAISLILVLLMASASFYLSKRKKNKQDKVVPLTEKSNAEKSHENDTEVPLFEFNVILAATDNFSAENKLGESGFGPVYKGKLCDGKEIAVKRLAKYSVQGLNEFKNEIMLIAKLQHRNLVRLLGYCIHREESILVYEYMPNKSLDVFLFDRTNGGILDWRKRYSIIHGIARGLLYLHYDSRLRIIHRDLKTSNILLDNEMKPKISDFGMARIFRGDETEVDTKRVVGTYGYMAPEYAMNGIFSVKSDVFSFGVMVLEIISGKRNRGVYMSSSHLNFIGYALNLWNDGKGIEIVDESIRENCPFDEALKCAHIGLLCVQERPEDRPLMDSVVVMLGSDGSSTKVPKLPGFSIRGNSTEAKPSTIKNDSTTSNKMTVSMLQGR